MVYKNDIGSKIQYRGASLGVFPKSIPYVVATLIAVDDDMAWIETGKDKIFAIKSEDCIPHKTYKAEEIGEIPNWSLSTYENENSIWGKL
jgi:hypothetical protein